WPAPAAPAAASGTYGFPRGLFPRRVFPRRVFPRARLSLAPVHHAFAWPLGAPPIGAARDSHRLKAAYAARSGREAHRRANRGCFAPVLAGAGQQLANARGVKAPGVAERPARPVLFSHAIL